MVMKRWGMDEYGNLCRSVVLLGYVWDKGVYECIDMSFGSSPNKCQSPLRARSKLDECRVIL